MIGETTGAPVELVVAVSEAGGMGVLGGSGFSVEGLRDAIREIKAKTKKPYGVDLLLPQKLDIGGGLGQQGPKELPLSAILKSLPKSHQDWVKKIKEEMQLPDVEIMVRMNSTTHAAEGSDSGLHRGESAPVLRGSGESGVHGRGSSRGGNEGSRNHRQC